MANNNTTVMVADHPVLPRNFETLPAKRQRQAVVEAFRDNLIAINDAHDDVERLIDSARRKSEMIRLSREGKELVKLRSEIKRLQASIRDLAAARQGMLGITKKLGFNVNDEIKNMKLIDISDN